MAYDFIPFLRDCHVFAYIPVHNRAHCTLLRLPHGRQGYWRVSQLAPDIQELILYSTHMGAPIQLLHQARQYCSINNVPPGRGLSRGPTYPEAPSRLDLDQPITRIHID